MKAGEPCRAPKQVCGVPTPHSHCDCGISIPIGGGYCSMCLRELTRGAVMTNDVSNKITQTKPAHLGQTFKLPEGFRSWQTTPYCRHGHEMTEANTGWVRANGGRRYRYCRVCHRRSNGLSEARRKSHGIPAHVHATSQGYNRYNCRCDLCRAYKKRTDRDRKLRQREGLKQRVAA